MFFDQILKALHLDNQPNKRSVGLALSGGAARGLAHIGVLEVLEEHGIRPSCICGASAGSLVGSLYAAGNSPAEILSIFENTSLAKIYRLGIPTLGLTSLDKLKNVMAEHLPETFEELSIPLHVSVANLNSGKAELISQGPLVDTIIASSSVPILFSPIKRGDELLVDGGLLNNLPVAPLLDKDHLIIGVDVIAVQPVDDIGNVIEIALRSLDLALQAQMIPNKERCDVVIEPAVGEYGWFDAGKAREIVAAGRAATQAKLSEILA